ncbi:MAG: PepSY-associated TM helix domain-containing protein [Methylococcales bacterium]|nr:PepSY-associated TM helix domain-containing protein [Methylococcales bacterium]
MKNTIFQLLTRTTWLKAHLYLALSLGLFFALMGLSGSISIYREELDGLLNPQLIIKVPQGTYQSLDKMMASVRTAHPNRYGAWTLEMPRSPQGMVTAWYEKPTETFFELYAPLMVSVNPYTGDVVMSRFWGTTATTWLLDLHTQLRLDRFGWNAVGILGLFLLMSCGSGLYLWWPGIKALSLAFKVRYKAGMMVFAFDLHRFMGLISAVSLIVLAFTGFLLSYPSILETFTGSSGMEHGQTGRTITSTAIPNNHPTGLSAASFVAQAPFPKAELRRVTTPAGDTGIYRINLRQSSEVNQRHPFTTIWVDRWSGQIKEVRNPAKFSKGEIFATWIWPLHTGEALGAKGRFIWFLSGLSVFVLYISGLLRWLCRTGWVRDREVNYSALIPLLRRLRKGNYRLIYEAYLLIRLFAKKAKTLTPHIRIAYDMLLKWIKQLQVVLLNKHKRFGKK